MSHTSWGERHAPWLAKRALRSTGKSTKKKIVVSCRAFGFRNRHGDRAGRAWILSVSRGFIGKKAQMGVCHEEKELEAVQTLESL